MATQNDSVFPLINNSRRVGCFYSSMGLYIIPSYTVVWSFLFLPLGFLVSHTAFQRWRQNKRSAVSHTDFFTYQTLFLEMIRYCGYVVYSLGSLPFKRDAMRWGLLLRHFSFPGLCSFHLLICFERYIAVVFPVVYLSLRKQKWIWLRKLIVVTSWLFGALWITAKILLKGSGKYFIQNVAALGVAATVIAFCSIHVLHNLRHPRPGEGGGVSQMKRRAFNTILVILLALMLWLVEGFVKIVIKKAKVLEPDVACLLQKSSCWFELASSLVSPILFLHRAGKLPKCRSRCIGLPETNKQKGDHLDTEDK